MSFIKQGSAAAAERVYRTLSVLFRSAEQDDVIARVPTRSKRHRPRRQKVPHVVLERAEARRMLLHVHGWQRDAALLQLSLGARFGEIAGLTPSGVDLRRGTVRIVRRVSSETVRANKNHRARILELPTAARSTVERLVAPGMRPGAVAGPERPRVARRAVVTTVAGADCDRPSREPVLAEQGDQGGLHVIGRSTARFVAWVAAHVRVMDDR